MNVFKNKKKNTAVICAFEEKLNSPSSPVVGRWAAVHQKAWSHNLAFWSMQTCHKQHCQLMCSRHKLVVLQEAVLFSVALWACTRSKTWRHREAVCYKCMRTSFPMNQTRLDWFITQTLSQCKLSSTTFFCHLRCPSNFIREPLPSL